MSNHIMLPPGGPNGGNTTVNGRNYVAAKGAALASVNRDDAHALEANGWINTTTHGTGTTAQRPTPQPGLPSYWMYYDTTLSAFICWNGVNWVNAQSGATV
jgi:hypothetical protein